MKNILQLLWSWLFLEKLILVSARYLLHRKISLFFLGRGQVESPSRRQARHWSLASMTNPWHQDNATWLWRGWVTTSLIKACSCVAQQSSSAFCKHFEWPLPVRFLLPALHPCMFCEHELVPRGSRVVIIMSWANIIFLLCSIIVHQGFSAIFVVDCMSWTCTFMSSLYLVFLKFIS